jgi:serine protease Do
VIGEQPKNLAQVGSEEGGESAAPAGLLSDLEVRELTDELAGRYGMKSSERGVIIVRVKPGSPAEEVGVREGDIVLEVNRKPVTSLKSYERLASNLPKEQPVLLLLKRQGRAIYLTLRP